MSNPADRVEYMLGEINGKLDAMKGDIGEIKENHKDYDKRLRRNEEKAAVSSAITGGIVGVVMSYITTKLTGGA